LSKRSSIDSMNENQSYNLDDLIEDALSTEPRRAAPAGFHDRLERRIREEAGSVQEARQARVRIIRATVLFTAIAAVCVGVPVVAFYLRWGHQLFPGGTGIVDYVTLAVAFVRSWDAIGVPTVVGACAVVVALGLAAGLFVVRGRSTARGHS